MVTTSRVWQSVLKAAEMILVLRGAQSESVILVWCDDAFEKALKLHNSMFLKFHYTLKKDCVNAEQFVFFPSIIDVYLDGKRDMLK